MHSTVQILGDLENLPLTNQITGLKNKLLRLRDTYCDQISFLRKEIIFCENYAMRNHGHIQNYTHYILVTI